MGLHIGVSGGHHKSAAVAIDNATVIGCAAGEGLNLHTVQHLKVASRLGVLLDDLAARIDILPTSLRERTEKLVLALPAGEIGYERQLAETCLAINEWPNRNQYEITDDTLAGLIGGALQPIGICAVAGTGAAVLVGLRDSFDIKKNKFDGWGHLLGDFGSGFQLAVDTFRFVGRAWDLGKSPSLFGDLLKEDPKIGSLDDVPRWFNHLYTFYPDDWRIRFAKLASAVTRAADRPESPDADAVKLVEHSAGEMASTIKIAIARFQPATETLPVILQGGMFEHSNLYRRTVARLVQQSHTGEVRMAAFRAVIGAGLMACAHKFKLLESDRCQKIIASINALPQPEQELVAYPKSSALQDHGGKHGH